MLLVVYDILQQYGNQAFTRVVQIGCVDRVHGNRDNKSAIIDYAAADLRLGRKTRDDKNSWCS